MYTVKDLIEALQQCPEDYEVKLFVGNDAFEIDELGINHGFKTVDLFAAIEEE